MIPQNHGAPHAPPNTNVEAQTIQNRIFSKNKKKGSKIFWGVRGAKPPGNKKGALREIMGGATPHEIQEGFGAF